MDYCDRHSILNQSYKVCYTAFYGDTLNIFSDKCDADERLARILSDIDLEDYVIYENQKFLILYEENVKVYTKTD